MGKFAYAAFSALSSDIMSGCYMPYKDSDWTWKKISLIGIDNGKFYWNCFGEKKFYYSVDINYFKFLGCGVNSINAYFPSDKDRKQLSLKDYGVEDISANDFSNFLRAVAPYLLQQFNWKFANAVITSNFGNYEFITDFDWYNNEPIDKTFYCLEIIVKRKKIVEEVGFRND